MSGDPLTQLRDDTNSLPENSPTVTIAGGGRYVKIHLPGPPPLKALETKRGPIKRFTQASRKRLMDRLQQIDQTRQPKLPLFITLTYPSVWPSSLAECKRHLDTFCKRLRRRYKDVAIVWKLEFQARGAPHFHLLVWNVFFIRHQQVARDWYEVVGSGLDAHLAAGTEVKRIRSWSGVSYYAAKYLAKVGHEECDESPGRFWGIIGREHLPVGLLVRVVAWCQAYQMRRALWKLAARRGYPARWRRRGSGVTSYLAASTAFALLGTVF